MAECHVGLSSFESLRVPLCLLRLERKQRERHNFRGPLDDYPFPPPTSSTRGGSGEGGSEVASDRAQAFAPWLKDLGVDQLGPPVAPFYRSFFGGGFHYNRLQKKGAIILF